MSKGVYNATYFKNHPEERDIESTLYIVVLVNKETHRRECVKIGITKGKDWKAVLKRAKGFTPYDVRIQKTVVGRLEDIFFLEDYLHEIWSDHRYLDSEKFGGHTELFDIEQLSNILKSVPENA